jgi:hypothetical protein
VSERARRNSTPGEFVERFVRQHKAWAAAIALIAIGATSATVLSQYATKDSVRQRSERIDQQIQLLRDTDASLRGAIETITVSTQNTRADVKELLKHVLANPSK